MPSPPPIAVARAVVARDPDAPAPDAQGLPAVVLTLYRAPGSDGTYSLVMQRGGPDRR